jgi:hypothetical protein
MFLDFDELAGRPFGVTPGQHHFAGGETRQAARCRSANLLEKIHPMPEQLPPASAAEVEKP